VTAHLVPVPEAFVRGPYVQEFECTVGAACDFVLRGLGLQTTNRLRLTNKPCSTGGWNYCTSRVFDDCSGLAPTISNGGKEATFALGNAASPQPQGLQLCWVSAPDAGDTAESTEFTIQVDASAAVKGP
jgi:hypothetical protein